MKENVDLPCMPNRESIRRKLKYPQKSSPFTLSQHLRLRVGSDGWPFGISGLEAFQSRWGHHDDNGRRKPTLLQHQATYAVAHMSAFAENVAQNPDEMQLCPALWLT